MKNLVMNIMLIVIIFSSVTLAAERVSLGFIYNATDSIELVNRTDGAINQVSPTCLNIDSKGNLIVTKDLTHEFVQEMKSRGILVIPFLSNHWIRSKGRAAINNADTLSEQIVTVINEYDIDGINVDIENLTPEDRNRLSEFVKILKNKMPQNKILTVSVAANPDGVDTGWQGSYDYEELGKNSDYLFVMTYDENSQGGECGPVASLEFVKKSINYALKYVSKDNIVMGIPLYGRFWKDDSKVGGEAVAIGALPTLISKNKGIVKYDEILGEACTTFNVDNSQIISRINGKILEDGNYTVWYQTEESIKAKLNIVNEYDLLGAGVWALGQEKVDVWEYYKNELNKIPYESLEEEKKREEYEALIVDLSRLKAPELISLKGEEIINESDLTKEDIIREKNKKINSNLMKEQEKRINSYEKISKKIKKESEKGKVISKNMIQLDNKKQLYMYRYCRKDALK